MEVASRKLSPEPSTQSVPWETQRYSALKLSRFSFAGKPQRATSSRLNSPLALRNVALSEMGDGDPNRIGLLIAATNTTPNQCCRVLASEKSWTETNVFFYYKPPHRQQPTQVCSVLLSSVEVAQWYLAANQDSLRFGRLLRKSHTVCAPLQCAILVAVTAR